MIKSLVISKHPKTTTGGEKEKPLNAIDQETLTAHYCDFNQRHTFGNLYFESQKQKNWISSVCAAKTQRAKQTRVDESKRCESIQCSVYIPDQWDALKETDEYIIITVL